MNESDAEMCNLYNSTFGYHPTAPFSYPSFLEGSELPTPTEHTNTKHIDSAQLYFPSSTISSSTSTFPVKADAQAESLTRSKKQDLITHLRRLDSEIRYMELSFERSISTLAETKETISAELENTQNALQIVREYQHRMYVGDEEFPETLEIARRLCAMTDGLRAERDGQERSIRDLTKRMEMVEANHEDNLQRKLDERAELRFEIVEFVRTLGDSRRNRMMARSDCRSWIRSSSDIQAGSAGK